MWCRDCFAMLFEQHIHTFTGDLVMNTIVKYSLIFAALGAAIASIALYVPKSKNTTPSSMRSFSSFGVVPTDDLENNLKESSTRYFPHRFSVSASESQNWFIPDAPYCVLEVKFLNNEKTLGVAKVEKMNGETFLTDNTRVIQIELRKYFYFPYDKKSHKVMDEPRLIPATDLDRYIEKYLALEEP